VALNWAGGRRNLAGVVCDHPQGIHGLGWAARGGLAGLERCRTVAACRDGAGNAQGRQPPSNGQHVIPAGAGAELVTVFDVTRAASIPASVPSCRRWWLSNRVQAGCRPRTRRKCRFCQGGAVSPAAWRRRRTGGGLVTVTTSTAAVSPGPPCRRRRRARASRTTFAPGGRARCRPRIAACTTAQFIAASRVAPASSLQRVRAGAGGKAIGWPMVDCGTTQLDRVAHGRRAAGRARHRPAPAPPHHPHKHQRRQVPGDGGRAERQDVPGRVTHRGDADATRPQRGCPVIDAPPSPWAWL
jgi:hypothetical protein